jgi:hypothetical protein
VDSDTGQVFGCEPRPSVITVTAGVLTLACLPLSGRWSPPRRRSLTGRWCPAVLGGGGSARRGAVLIAQIANPLAVLGVLVSNTSRARGES